MMSKAMLFMPLMNGGLKLDHNFMATYKNVCIRQLERADIELLRQWRNEEENTKYISQIGHITPEKQNLWFDSYLNDDDNCTFAIDEIGELNRCVGSVSLYNFGSNSVECGKFMMGDPEARGKGVGRLGIILCMFLGFEKFKLNQITAVVHQDNIAALTTDQKAGFVIVGKHPYGDGKEELELLCEKEYFYTRHGFLKDVKMSKNVRGGGLYKLRLRTLKIDDGVFMLEWMKDSDINRYFRFDPDQVTLESVCEFIKMSQDFETNANFAITDESEEYLGTVSLKNIDQVAKNAEYAISLRKKVCGRKYGYSATLKILNYAFNKIKLERIYLNVLSDNENAISFYKKLGFIYEGEFKNHLSIHGKLRSLKWFRLMRNEAAYVENF
jgi:diamine N-acetyltransferase